VRHHQRETRVLAKFSLRSRQLRGATPWWGPRYKRRPTEKRLIGRHPRPAPGSSMATRPMNCTRAVDQSSGTTSDTARPGVITAALRIGDKAAGQHGIGQQPMGECSPRPPLRSPEGCGGLLRVRHRAVTRGALRAPCLSLRRAACCIRVPPNLSKPWSHLCNPASKCAARFIRSLVSRLAPRAAPTICEGSGSSGRRGKARQERCASWPA